MSQGFTGSGASTGTGNFVKQNQPTINQPIINGVTNGSAAAAGEVGEILTASIGNTVPLTASTNTDVLTLSLTPGSWDIRGWLNFVANATTIPTLLDASLNIVSATLPSASSINFPRERINANFVASSANILSLATGQLNISVTTTLYLIGFAVFTVSTMTAGGAIIARRMR